LARGAAPDAHAEGGIAGEFGGPLRRSRQLESSGQPRPFRLESADLAFSLGKSQLEFVTHLNGSMFGKMIGGAIVTPRGTAQRSREPRRSIRRPAIS
jgi:hypothetical protein